MTFASQRERRLCYVAVTLAMVEVDDKHFDLEMQLRPTGRLGRRCTARAAVRMRDQSSWDERAMIRFVPRGLGAQDRLSTTPCAAPTLHILRQLVCAALGAI